MCLNSGSSYIKHVDSKIISKWLKGKQFEATADMARLEEADALTDLRPDASERDADPDLIFVEKTAGRSPPRCDPDSLWFWKARPIPRRTGDVVLPILNHSGLTAGKDFFWPTVPNAEDPGNPDYSAAGNSKSDRRLRLGESGTGPTAR